MRTIQLAAILVLSLATPAAADVPRIDIRAAKAIRDEPKVPARLTVGGRTHRIGIEVRGGTRRSPTASRRTAACTCSGCRPSATGS